MFLNHDFPCSTFALYDTKIIHLRVQFSLNRLLFTIVMYVVLIFISCNVFLTGIIASPNTYTNFATEYELELNPSTVYQPPVRNLKEKMDMKELIETLQKKFRRSSTPIPVTVSDETNCYYNKISLDDIIDIDFFF